MAGRARLSEEPACLFKLGSPLGLVSVPAGAFGADLREVWTVSPGEAAAEISAEIVEDSNVLVILAPCVASAA